MKGLTDDDGARECCFVNADRRYAGSDCRLVEKSHGSEVPIEFWQLRIVTITKGKQVVRPLKHDGFGPAVTDRFLCNHEMASADSIPIFRKPFLNRQGTVNFTARHGFRFCGYSGNNLAVEVLPDVRNEAASG